SRRIARSHPIMRNCLSQSLFLALAVTLAAAAEQPKAASDARFAAVDAAVQQALDAGQAPGVVVVVGHDGHVVYRKAFGFRAVEPEREPMTLDTIFDMASLTKSMATSMSVMRLVQNGQVGLNDTLAKFIPECASNGKGEITLRQLLTHYSGLRPD